MVKKSTHGGVRSNAGRPATGKNTKTISYSVHVDFVPVIDATVKQKVKELKAAQAKANETGEPVTITLLPQQPLKHISLPKNELVAQVLNSDKDEPTETQPIIAQEPAVVEKKKSAGKGGDGKNGSKSAKNDVGAKDFIRPIKHKGESAIDYAERVNIWKKKQA